ELVDVVVHQRLLVLVKSLAHFGDDFGDIDFHLAHALASVRPRESGDPVLCAAIGTVWVPAFAGTNGVCCECLVTMPAWAPPPRPSSPAHARCARQRPRAT